MNDETPTGPLERIVRPPHLTALIADKLSAEGVHWHETAKGVAALKETCAPTSLICAYLITRLAEELSDQLSAPRGPGYDIEVGPIRDAWEAVREGNRFVDRLPNAGLSRRPTPEANYQFLPDR